MKKSTPRNALLSIIALFFFSECLHGQWISAGSVTNIGSYPSISVVDQNTAWIAGGPSGTPVIYRTTDGGTTWTQLATGGLALEMYCVWAASATTGYVGNGGAAGGAGGNAKFYVTLNGGTSWTLIDSTGGSAGFFNSIVFSKTDPSVGIAQSDPPAGAGQTYYLSKTTDGGITWTRTSPPGISGAASAQNSIFVIAENFYGFGLNAAPPRVYMTSNGGTSWYIGPLGLAGDFVSGVAFKDDKLTGIAVTSTSLPNIARTTNGGVTWTAANTGTGLSGSSSVKWITGTNVCYLSGTAAMAKSTDAGITWNTMTVPPGTSGLTHMEFARIGTLVLGYAVTNTGSVLGLVDIVSGVVDSVNVAFGLGPGAEDNIASVTGSLYSDNCDSVRVLGLVFTWRNAPPYNVPNLNWKAGRKQRVQQNFPLPPAAPGFPDDVHLVYVVYPGGATQTLDIDILVAGRFYTLAPPCAPTGVGEDYQLPDRFLLLQNYPNPFNPSTIIRYQLPVHNYVTLKVYDVLGREVATLVDEVQGSGFKSVVFDASRLSSGVYFYRLSAGGFVETRKMCVIR